MERTLFVLNPIAGGGRAKDLEELIKNEIKDLDIKYDIVCTTKPEEATEIVKNTDYDYYIAIGGDGTVNEVAKGILEKGSGVMGIIPGGTGNDLARSLGISLVPEEALKIFKNCEIRELNICKANNMPFFNISSIGFDAEVVNRASKIKHIIKGQIAYTLSVLYTLIAYRNKKAKVIVDGEEIKVNLLLLAVGNGKYYGGGFYIMPNSKIDDGYLHSCFITDIPRPVLLTLFPSILKGEHIRYTKYVKEIKAKKIIIETDENLYFNLDGEILDAGNRLEFEIGDEKIPMICPKN